jgi:hypothetical protein
MRIVFVKSSEAKKRLKPALDAGNVDKTMAAPVTAILGMGIQFFEQLPKLFPHRGRQGGVQGPAGQRTGLHRVGSEPGPGRHGLVAVGGRGVDRQTI